MDVSLILYAEHEFNASTFTARVCASTLSDMHSCVTGAIGSLRGPLHGGANEAAMELIEKFATADEASTGLLGMLERKKRSWASVMPSTTPRILAMIIKQWAEKLANEVGDTVLYPVSCAIEKSCGMKKHCLLTRISFTPRPITSWAFPRNCLHRLCVLAGIGLECSRHGAARKQPYHSSQRGLHRPRASGSDTAGGPLEDLIGAACLLWQVVSARLSSDVLMPR